MTVKLYKASVVVFVCQLWFRATNSEFVACTNDQQCDFNSKCNSSISRCRCNDGFISVKAPEGKYGKDCVDVKCGNSKCYTCLDSTRCQRCVAIVMDDTGKCVDQCSTETTLKFTGDFQGEVCRAPDKPKFTKEEFIGLIVGLVLVAIIFVVIGVAVFCIRAKKSDDAAAAARSKRSKSKSRKSANKSNDKDDNVNDNKLKKDLQKTLSKNCTTSPASIQGAKDYEL